MCFKVVIADLANDHSALVLPLRHLLQINNTLIRQLLQEQSGQGILYLIMLDKRINIFLCAKTKNIQVA